MYIVLLLASSCVSWTYQHLTYPINYCNMATTCIHDNNGVCASTPDGCSRRTFMDQCDMYEYNCDYGTKYNTKSSSPCVSGHPDLGYQETYIYYCTLQTNAHTTTQSSIYETSFIDDNSIEDKTSSSYPKTESFSTKLSKNAEVTTKLISRMTMTKTSTTNATDTITSSHISLPVVTTTKISKPTMISTPTFPTAVVTTKDTTTMTTPTQSSTTLELTTKLSYESTTSENINVPSECCERPKTWYTTKEELPSTYFINFTTPSVTETTNYITIPFTNNLTTVVESTNKAQSTTLYSTIKSTIDRVTTYVTRIPIEPTSPILNITESKPITSTDLQSTTSDQTEHTVIETIPCCDRPSFWYTETESVIPRYFNITQQSDSSAEIPTPVNTVTLNSETTESESATTEVLESTRYRTPTSEITTKHEYVDTTPQESITKTTTTKHASLPATDAIWYPTPCKSTNCEMPITWLTTKQKKYRRH